MISHSKFSSKFSHYGFVEKAGNFQNNNRVKGGKGDDEVLVSIQERDKSVKNNAWFSTGPDGENGIMAVGLFDTGRPVRDAALDSIVIMHEYTHGITNRLTGGKSNAECLNTKEASSMGEGWSDIISLIINRKKGDTWVQDHVVGDYSYNQPGGFRSYPYSTNMITNPLTYHNMYKCTDPHDGGEIWASALFEVYWIMVDKYGFSEDLYNADQTQGNIVLLNLFFGGLMSLFTKVIGLKKEKS